jgi:type II secretory pathway component PulK
MSSLLGDNPYDNATAFQNVQLNPNETNPRRRGSFIIYAPVDPDDTASSGQSMRYGVIDEAGKINLNALIQLDPSGEVAFDVLMKLPNMTEEIADAIIDWIDADDEQRPSGAENSHYSGQSPGYLCKNGPLDSLEELLLIKGVTPELLFGTDSNRNGVEDQGENDGSGWSAGWSPYLTIYSRERNVDSEGTARTFLNDTDLKTSYDKLKTAVGETLANYIILYRTQQQGTGGSTTTSVTMSGGGGVSVVIVANTSRNQNASPADIQEKVAEILQSSQQRPRSLSSRFELINTSVTWTVGQGRNQRTVQMSSPLNDPAQLRTLLPTLLDKTTTQQTAELPARVNVMTASRSVMSALPGNLTEEDIQSIIDKRPTPGSEMTDPVYSTVAWLMTDANISVDKMRALERYITARTQVYRVQVLGQFDSAGPSARVEAVIDTNNGRPRIVMYRDLTELGRGLSANQ